MRKIGVIIALALVLTIGGVYATFDYAENSPAAKDSNFLATVLEDANVTEIGTISLGANTLQLKVKNKGNNVTGLDVIDGSLTATFAANNNASADIKTNGIFWGLRIDFEGTNEFRGQAVLTTTSHGDGFDKVAFSGGVKAKSITLNDESLRGIIGVTEFTLSTKADYDAYKAVLDGITIKITISQYKP